jgi:YgiT-type zinc finger domain-containing protein
VTEEETKMKCVVCKSTDIEKKQIEEEIRAKNDIVLVPMAVLVCVNCGERYYDQQAMRKIEFIRSELKNNSAKTEVIGRVLRAVAA